MAANTFLEMTRSLRLFIPQLPATLAEHFIRDRYRRVLERRRWSALKKEAEFQLNAAKETGTVSVVRGSSAVVGTGTTFAATDVGRQFKVGSYPMYTIAAWTDAENIELDRPYGGTTDTEATFKILDAYVTVPDDFLSFISVADPEAGYRLRHWITAAELNTVDPQRVSYGNPYVIADRLFNAAGTLPQYEAWPYNTTEKTLYYVYAARGEDLLEDSDIPIWPLRSDVLVKGALADAAKWPGTSEQPNPYFARPEYWKSYESEFEDMMIDLERRDEEIYMTWLGQYAYNEYGLAPMSASFIQSHAI